MVPLRTVGFSLNLKAGSLSPKTPKASPKEDFPLPLTCSGGQDRWTWDAVLYGCFLLI